MTSEKPSTLYKYQSIDKMVKDDSGKEVPRSIDSLVKNEAWFSSRISFNDLFDSKIDLIMATPQEIKALKGVVDKKQAKELSTFIHKGKLTLEGEKLLSDIKTAVIQTIDKYKFYCLSEHDASNLMWAHYASSHQGFCIEFKSEYINATKVAYEKEIPSIKVLNFIKQQYLSHDENVINAFGEELWKALTTKLIEWEYEGEYRFQPSNEMETRMVKSTFKYSSNHIESIIFGCRMKDDLKQYIIDNLPAQTRFKEAKAGKSCIKIVDYIGQSKK